MFNLGVSGAVGGGVVATWANWDGTLDGAAVSNTGSPNAGRAKVCMLTSSTVISFWSDAISHLGTACVGTITGDSVAWGTPVTVTGVTTVAILGSTELVGLTSSQAIVVFDDNATGFLGTFVINISGTIPTGGTITTTSITLQGVGIGIDKTSSTQAICAWSDSGTSSGRMAALSVSASVVTVGTIVVFGSTTDANFTVSVSNISSSAALIFYADSGNSHHPTAQIITISGTTLSTNTTKVIDSTVTSAAGNQVSYIAQLSSTLFVVAYSDSSNTYAAAFTISGTTVGTPGSPVTVSAVSHTQNTNALCDADSTSVMFGYIDGSSNFIGRVGTVSGTAITLKTAIQTQAATCSVPGLCNLDTQHIMSIYANGSTIGYGQVLSIV